MRWYWWWGVKKTGGERKGEEDGQDLRDFTHGDGVVAESQ